MNKEILAMNNEEETIQMEMSSQITGFPSDKNQISSLKFMNAIFEI